MNERKTEDCQNHGINSYIVGSKSDCCSDQVKGIMI